MAEFDKQLVHPERLARSVRGIFVGLGLPESDAAVVADSLVQADLRGVHSHGVMRVKTYAHAIATGEINPRPNLTWPADEGTRAVLDADRAMGQVAAYHAMRSAIDRAREHGVGMVGVRRSNHCGAMAHWANMALEHDLIGYAATNAGINMAPWGGKERLVGNNPFAIAVPTNRPWPMVLDMATSVAAGGKLDMAAIRGQPIPPDWALDPEGRPTTDPRVGRQGSLLPVGGPKGYGMAVMLDVLCGVLTGGRFGKGLGEPGSGHFFMAIAIDGLMPIDVFKSRMDELIDQLHAAALAPGFDRIYVPGEIEYELSARRQQEGIPVEGPILAELEELAASFGVEERPSQWK